MAPPTAYSEHGTRPTRAERPPHQPAREDPEAAQLRSIGRSTVNELIADGQLDTVHFGRAVRITTAAIEAFVDRQQSEHRQTISESTQRR